jgi:hypothetical protein
MLSLIFFSICNYFFGAYFISEKTHNLFLGGLFLGAAYIFAPDLIIIIPFYVLVFALFNHYSKKIKKVLIFTALMPTAAAAFSLSYLSWLNQNGFKLIYQNNSVLSFRYSFSGSLDWQNWLLKQLILIIIICLPYLYLIVREVINKNLNRPYLYLLLLPFLWQFLRFNLYGSNDNIYFYLIYWFHFLLFFKLFYKEIKTGEKKIIFLTVIIAFIFNSLYFYSALSLYFEENFLSKSLAQNEVINFSKEIVKRSWPGLY